MDAKHSLARDEAEEILNKRLNGFRNGYRQNIAILGNEYTGKTNTITNLLGAFQDNLILPVYIETKHEDIPSFILRFIKTMLYNFLQNSSLTLRDDYEFLLDNSQKFIPETAKKISLITSAAQKNPKSAQLFFDLFSLTETLNKETSKLPVVIIDEFQALENLRIKNLYREMGKIICFQKKTMYILISSACFKAKRILQEDLSLLFGNFEVIEMRSLDTQGSQSLLAQRMKTLEIDPILLKFLINFGDGYPLYITSLSESINQSAQSSKTRNVTLEMFAQSLADALSDECSVLNKIFQARLETVSQIGAGKNSFEILGLISEGKNLAREISLNLRQTSKKTIAEINTLIENDLITKSGDFYTFNDRMFNFWYKFIYRQTLTRNPLLKNEFRLNLVSRIIEEIRSFIASDSMDILERTVELFGSFNNESVLIERKRLKLKSFREIKILHFNNKCVNEAILGRSSDNIWITAFKNNSLVTEEDVITFSKECRKFHTKAHKEFILVSGDVDINAKLLAKEEKISTWNFGHLNILMDLYGKPRIIK